MTRACLALVVALIALTAPPVRSSCTVGTMANADFYSLQDALLRCPEDSDGAMRLYIEGAFPVSDLLLQRLDCPSVVSIEPYPSAPSRPVLSGYMMASAVPMQLRVLALSGIVVDYEGGACGMAIAELSGVELEVRNCEFANGICYELWTVANSPSVTITGNVFTNMNVTHLFGLYDVDALDIANNTVAGGNTSVPFYIEKARVIGV